MNVAPTKKLLEQRFKAEISFLLYFGEIGFILLLKLPNSFVE